MRYRNLRSDRRLQPRHAAASFKNVKQITAAIAAGAHCVTVQPALIKTAMTSALVGDAVAAFTKDYELVIKGK